MPGFGSRTAGGDGARGDPRRSDRPAAETPHIILNAPLVGQRLGYPELSGLDLLELFAFFHPARFAVPTSAGLGAGAGARAAGRRGRSRGVAAADCRALAGRARRSGLARARRGVDGRTRPSTGSGWGWAPLVAARARPQPERGERMLFSRLPQWEESAERPPPRTHRRSPPRRRGSSSIELTGQEPSRARARKRWPKRSRQVFAPRKRAKGMPNMLLAEAGTGIGKTLAYLAPGVAVGGARAAARCGCRPSPRRCSGSSTPKARKLFADAEERARRIVVRKGRENYLCLLNLEDALQGAFAGRAAILAQLVGRWAAYTKDGDMVGGDLPGWLPSLFRRAGAAALTDRRGECVYAGCPHYRRCFIERAERAEPRGGHRHRQPCAGDGQCRARARRTRRRRILFDEGHHLFDAADFDLRRRASAGRKRSRCGAGSSGPKGVRAGGGAGSRRG